MLDIAADNITANNKPIKPLGKLFKINEDFNTNKVNEESIAKTIKDSLLEFKKMNAYVTQRNKIYPDSLNIYVTPKTKFSKSGKSWWRWGNNKVNMNINYIVKMPVTNSVDLNNDYGNINLDKLEGHAKINCDYGEITTKELLAENNNISFDYTNNSYFEYINSAEINADYSGFTVGQTKSLHIKADYTKSKVEIAENITYSCDYGSFSVDKINNLEGNGDYLTVRIGDVYRNIHINADYGSLKIDQMTANAGNLTVESNYLGITIGYHPDYHFNFDANIEYGSMKNTADFEFTKKNIESNTNYYQGYYGSRSTANLIKINSDYGSVTFKKN